MTETPNPNIVDTDTLTGEMHPIRRCVLAIGSNLGDRINYLQGAVSSLADTPEVWLTEVSPVYESDARRRTRRVGKDFLNAVVLADTTLSARTLLDRALAIEDAYGRERGEPGAPRTLDVDLIVVGDRRANEDDLVLPHPKAHERAFVLAPWNDVESDAELLDQGPVAELLAKASSDGVTRRDDLTLSLQ